MHRPPYARKVSGSSGGASSERGSVGRGAHRRGHPLSSSTGAPAAHGGAATARVDGQRLGPSISSARGARGRAGVISRVGLGVGALATSPTGRTAGGGGRRWSPGAVHAQRAPAGHVTAVGAAWAEDLGVHVLPRVRMPDVDADGWGEGEEQDSDSLERLSDDDAPPASAVELLRRQLRAREAEAAAAARSGAAADVEGEAEAATPHGLKARSAPDGTEGDGEGVGSGATAAEAEAEDWDADCAEEGSSDLPASALAALAAQNALVRKLEPSGGGRDMTVAGDGEGEADDDWGDDFDMGSAQPEVDTQPRPGARAASGSDRAAVTREEVGEDEGEDDEDWGDEFDLDGGGGGQAASGPAWGEGPGAGCGFAAALGNAAPQGNAVPRGNDEGEEEEQEEGDEEEDWDNDFGPALAAPQPLSATAPAAPGPCQRDQPRGTTTDTAAATRDAGGAPALAAGLSRTADATVRFNAATGRWEGNEEDEDLNLDAFDVDEAEEEEEWDGEGQEQGEGGGGGRGAGSGVAGGDEYREDGAADSLPASAAAEAPASLPATAPAGTGAPDGIDAAFDLTEADAAAIFAAAGAHGMGMCGAVPAVSSALPLVLRHEIHDAAAGAWDVGAAAGGGRGGRGGRPSLGSGRDEEDALLDAWAEREPDAGRLYEAVARRALGQTGGAVWTPPTGGEVEGWGAAGGAAAALDEPASPPHPHASPGGVASLPRPERPAWASPASAPRPSPPGSGGRAAARATRSVAESVTANSRARATLSAQRAARRGMQSWRGEGWAAPPADGSTGFARAAATAVAAARRSRPADRPRTAGAARPSPQTGRGRGRDHVGTEHATGRPAPRSCSRGARPRAATPDRAPRDPSPGGVPGGLGGAGGAGTAGASMRGSAHGRGATRASLLRDQYIKRKMQQRRMGAGLL